MESQPRVPDAEAAMTLRAAEVVRERATRVPRGHAVMQLLYAVMMSAYTAVFLFTGSAGGSPERFGATTMTLLLPPIILSSALAEGAAQRYGGRLRATKRYWMAVVAFAVMLGSFLMWSLIGGGYPWWSSLVGMAATLTLFGARPAAVLLGDGDRVHRTAATAPLPKGSRVTTVVIGFAFGAICASLFLPVAAWAVMAASMLLVLVAATATPTWGLRATGWYWGAFQWCAFGATTGLMFLLAVLTIATELITPLVSASAGALIAASLAFAAFLPGRGDDEEGVDGASEA